MKWGTAYQRGMSEGRYLWPLASADEEVGWVRGVLESSAKPFNALDPLCGPGTVLYECGLRGWKCTGMEADPMRRWISMARSFRYRPNAAEFCGYAWERVADDVFWESEMYTVPDVPGTMEFGSLQTDFLRRVRRQIDRETDEGINNLLRLMIVNALGRFGSEAGFDDRTGMDILGDSLQEVRSALDPNPELSQTVHLCDSRDIPCPLRNSYDLVVSVLPMLNAPEDAVFRRTAAQWIGFGDLVRRDDMSVGYPLGDFDDYMSRYVPDKDGVIGDMLPDVSGKDYLVRWFEDVRDVLVSLKGVMSSKCTAHLLVPDETYDSKNISKAEILAEIANSMGFACEKEGTGRSRCVVFKKAQ